MLKNLLMDEQGQGMVEYGLIIAVVALIAVVGLTALGGDLKTKFEGIKSALSPTV